MAGFDDVRKSLPIFKEPKLDLGMMWKLFKDLVGKDLSKFSLPVFLNEPLTVLQKAGEMQFFNSLITQASLEEDPVKRITLIAVHSAASQNLICGRTAKPFNPMLGETYELVTPNYRFFSESVSHHPPIACTNCQGDGYEIYQTVVTKMSFTGKAVKVSDQYPSYIEL